MREILNKFPIKPGDIKKNEESLSLKIIPMYALYKELATRRIQQIEHTINDAQFIAHVLKRLHLAYATMASGAQLFYEQKEEFFFLDKRRRRIIVREMLKNHPKGNLQRSLPFPVMSLIKALNMKCPLCQKEHPIISFGKFPLGGYPGLMGEKFLICMQFTHVVKLDKNGNIPYAKYTHEEIST